MTALNIDLSKFTGLDKAKEQAKLEDPRKFFLDEMGDLSAIRVAHNLVLVKIYERSTVSKGGIIRTDNAKKEDIWQGVVGLVLKKGPLAFVDDDKAKFSGFGIEVGDWVFFSTPDTSRIHVKGKECRIMQDVNIKGVIEHPDMVY